MSADLVALREDYNDTLSRATKFVEELENQISGMLGQAHIYLAVPIQGRVKSWDSIAEKHGRKNLTLEHVSELTDLVGLRVILLFRRDVETACRLIGSHLRVLEEFDTSDRLGEDQFGYTSNHLIVTLPTAWEQVPTFAPLKGLMAEIQVRTVAQHAWAAASHTLQYKVEASVPPSVRRSINRVAALLETVDLEFERVLDERQKYREAPVDRALPETLNVDLLEKVLDGALPARNRVPTEDYEGLLVDLNQFRVDDSEQLRALLGKHGEAVLVADRTLAATMTSTDELGPVEAKRARAGYWLTHTGLVREVMKREFGERWTQYRQMAPATLRLGGR